MQECWKSRPHDKYAFRGLEKKC